MFPTVLGVDAVDEAVGADQFRQVSTTGWTMSFFGTQSRRYAVSVEAVSCTWVPADPAREWYLVRRLTGRRRWILGSEADAVNDGHDVTGPGRWRTGRWRAPYGDFSAASAGRPPGPREAGWQTPSPEFLALLPRDPSRLLDRLRADSPADRPGYCGPFQYARDALCTGLVPADLRAALYAALLLMGPDRVTVEPPNPGAGHLAVRFADGYLLHDVHVSLHDAQFAGELVTVVGSHPELPAGTVLTDAATSVSIADAPDFDGDAT